MKHLKKLAFVSILGLVMTSCSLFNVDVDTTFSEVLNINVEESMTKGALDPPYHFIESVDLDPQEDEDVKKYADKVVEVGVGNITATVVQVSKKDVSVLKGGIVKISASGMDDATYILQDDWDIVMDASFQLDNQDGFYEDVSAILKEMKTFTLMMDGYSTVSGVMIGLKFSIEATVSGSIF